MAKENLSTLSTEELIKKKKTMSFATGLLAGVLTVLFFITITQTIHSGFTPLLVTPFALIPILIISFKQVNSIKKELESRNTNQKF